MLKFSIVGPATTCQFGSMAIKFARKELEDTPLMKYLLKSINKSTGPVYFRKQGTDTYIDEMAITLCVKKLYAKLSPTVLEELQISHLLSSDEVDGVYYLGFKDNLPMVLEAKLKASVNIGPTSQIKPVLYLVPMENWSLDGLELRKTLININPIHQYWVHYVTTGFRSFSIVNTSAVIGYCPTREDYEGEVFHSEEQMKLWLPSIDYRNV